MQRLLISALCLAAASCVVEPDPTIERRNWRDIPVVPVSDRDGITIVSADPPPTRIELDKPAAPKRVVVRDAIVTAYCPCKRCTPGKGLTKLETSAWCPGVAADWRFWPAGTMVIVKGYNNDEPVMVDDEGGKKVKGRRRFDVRTTYHWEARNWGRQEIEVIIVSVPRG